MLKGKHICLLLPVLAVGAQLHALPAFAQSPFLVVPDPAVAEQSAAYRYANMSDDEALSELDRRGILYSRVETEKPSTIRTPIRLTGRLHGVYFHSALPPEERVKSPYEILDARLALALDDFAALLEQQDIDEVVHFSLYRPNGPHPSHAQSAHRTPAPKTAPKKNSTNHQKTAKQSHSIEIPPIKSPQSKPKKVKPAPKKAAPPGTRHPAGLAIDIGLVHKKDGRWLNVKSHFQGQINTKACPADLSVLTNQDTRDLRAIACAAMDRALFTYILTPNYDAAHADHYHMEIKPGVRWFLIH